jgi:hypothetical protein
VHTVAPAKLLYVPAAQLKQFPETTYVPAGQSPHTAAPGDENFPTGQLTHVVDRVAPVAAE